ncbi:T6SS effector BTH_I2691 family protein, partial [Denitromonas iodatirespirans]
MSSEIAEQPVGPVIKASSVLSPVSNTQRKVVRIRDSQKVDRPVTEKHVALLPVRYAITPRSDGPAYAYDAGTLKRDLPKADTARYVLRALRPGFVYLYVDSKLLCFEVTSGGNLREGRNNPAGVEVLVEYAALLLPTRYGDASLAYSEHEWTAKQRQRVETNEGNARTHTMQSFALAAPTQDACLLSELEAQVEEYAGRAGEYMWSDTPGATKNADLYERLPTLAEDGQHIVALADPIGVSHDYAALVEQALGEIKQFVSDPDDASGNEADADDKAAVRKNPPPIPLLVKPPEPDPVQASSDAGPRARYRKKLVAETIGRLYERHVKQGADPDRLAKLRLEYWRKEPANRGKPEPTLAELKRDVITSPSVAPGADRLIKHIDENARRQFLADYDAELKKLSDVLEKLRLDRLVWLSSWRTRGNPHSLHTAWRTFDTDNLLDWIKLEVSFARSIAALGMSPTGGPQETESAQNQELELIGQWLAASLDDSPLYRALAGHPPLREAAANLKLPDPFDTAADRSGATLDGIANIIDDLHRSFPYTLGTEEIVHSMTVYLLAKPNAWRGAVADNIDSLLARLAGNGDAATAVRALMARYGNLVTTTRRTLSEYSRLFVEAAGNPPGLTHTMDQLAKTGNLRTDGYTTFEVQETTTTRHAILGRGQPNPFRGWGTVGISALAGMLYLVNLRMAVEQLSEGQDFESFSNFGSAVAAIGSGVNAGLMAFQVATPRPLEHLYRRSSFVRALGGVKALRLFGYAGAFLTGATLGIQSGKLIGSGDTDAGLWYASSALSATVGGSALTYASGALAAGTGTLLLTPVGWLIVGVVLVGGSIYLGFV